MEEFWDKHGQKFLGSAVATLGFAMTGIAGGQLDKVIGDMKDVWLFALGCLMTLLGGLVTIKANGVSAGIKVAEAMKTAIEATPGEVRENKDITAMIQPLGEKK